jgi:hypothetical protein
LNQIAPLDVTPSNPIGAIWVESLHPFVPQRPFIEAIDPFSGLGEHGACPAVLPGARSKHQSVMCFRALGPARWSTVR